MENTGIMVSGLLLSVPGLLLWIIIFFLPWRPWSTRESLDSTKTGSSTDLSGLTVLIPARNEEAVIAQTLKSVAIQGNGQRIILIDDQSDDQTVNIARNTNLPDLEIINGSKKPSDWSGKLWALEQGRLVTNSDLILLLDADINLEPGILATVVDKLEKDNLDMISLMAFLRMENSWEKMLMPAFIFFFKLLYPFRISNSRSQLIAAAAGGFILIRRNNLDNCGAFKSLRTCLIDDCSLARKIKDAGGKTWTGLTHSVISQRAYNKLEDVWNMVTRTAFTQLHYSITLLLVCTVLMVCCFVLPIMAVILGNSWQILTATLSLLLMYLCYLPTLNYYNINPLWGCLLPFSGLLYLCMTWSSALQHWFGSGSEWKNRKYSSNVH